MSKSVEVLDNEDMPCEEWKSSGAAVDACPMKEEWHEGEIRVCNECGYKIAYNCKEV